MVAQWNPGDGSSDGKCLNIVITLYWCLAFFFPFTGTDLSCDHLHCWWWMAMKPHKLVNGYPWIDLSSFSWFSQSSWLDHIFFTSGGNNSEDGWKGCRTLCEGKELFTDACFHMYDNTKTTFWKIFTRKEYSLWWHIFPSAPRHSSNNFILIQSLML